MIALCNKENIDILIRAISELEKKCYINDKKWNDIQIKDNPKYILDIRKSFYAWLLIQDYCDDNCKNEMILLNYEEDFWDILNITEENFNQIIDLIPNI